MRPIKFRGKRLDNGQWMYGYVLHCEKYTDIWTAEGEFERKEVDPETVGQFTGLTDKNGKEIYEGDIVSITLHYNNSCESSYNAVVKQTDGAFGFGNVNGFAPLYGRGKSEIEVIGNIHDNPELLKGGKQ